MYVLIDTDNMKAMAKHPNFQFLHNYGILVCSESAAVLPLEPGFLEKEFDDVQLQLLYINTTGNQQGASYRRNVVSKILFYYFNQMAETKINANSSDQAQWAIDNEREGSCSYRVSGSVPDSDVNGNPAFFTLQNAVAELAIDKGQALELTPGTQPAWTPARESSGTTAPASSERSTAPRASGTRDIIYAKADEMWEYAGKPTDKATILLLRRDIMNVLESEGVKRNTSSNTLGNWQKERIG